MHKSANLSIYVCKDDSLICSICLNPAIRSDEGLTLETSAFEALYGGQFTLSTHLIKPNYLKQYSLVPTRSIEIRGSRELRDNRSFENTREMWFSTFPSCPRMPAMFYHSVLHSIGFFIC